jgi:hypothetical protein
MRAISLVLVVVSLACYREAASPPSAPSGAPPIANKAATRAEPRASRDILAYLPADSDAVIGVDFKALRASALWEHFRPKVYAAIGARLAMMRDRCGYDPIEAVESAVMSVRWGEGRDSVVVIRGFDRDAFTACLTGKADGSGAVVVANDHGILTLTNPMGRTLMAAFADRSTLVLQASNEASPDSLRAVLRRGAPLRRSPDFLAQLERASTDAALWLVMTGNSSMFRALPAVGPRMRGVYASVVVGAIATLAVHIEIDDASQAALGAANLDQQLKQLRPLFDKLTATSDGAELIVTCEMSLQQVQRTIDLVVARYSGLTAKP